MSRDKNFAIWYHYVILGVVSVPDSKPTPVWIAFSTAQSDIRTHQMRSGDEIILRVVSKEVSMCALMTVVSSVLVRY